MGVITSISDSTFELEFTLDTTFTSIIINVNDVKKVRPVPHSRLNRIADETVSAVSIVSCGYGAVVSIYGCRSKVRTEVEVS